MECSRAQALIHGSVDGELDALARLRLDRHLASCPQCRAEREHLRAWRSAIRTKAPYQAAPPLLATHIGAALRRELPPVVAARRFLSVGSWPRPAWAGAGALAGMALALVLTTALPGQVPITGFAADRDRVVEEVLAGHVRSLMADHLTDVASSDQHTVKPWFAGRIALSPPVKDLATIGYPLIGGRLDYIDRQPAAALVYRHREHVINLFIRPASGTGDIPVRSLSHRGYHVVTWNRGGLGFWAVSDVAIPDLEAFVAAYEQIP
jgi:anti-sigma factor RsiW